MQRRIERIADVQVQKIDGQIRVVQTVEVEETLSISEIQGRLQAEEMNLQMYQNQLVKTQERIDRYRELLAEHYSSPEGNVIGKTIEKGGA